jgi:hypothetical protein
VGPCGSNRWCGATRPSLPVSESSALKSPELTPSRGGILPSSHCGGGWGRTGWTTDNLWDIRSRSYYP